MLVMLSQASPNIAITNINKCKMMRIKVCPWIITIAKYLTSSSTSGTINSEVQSIVKFNSLQTHLFLNLTYSYTAILKLNLQLLPPHQHNYLHKDLLLLPPPRHCQLDDRVPHQAYGTGTKKHHDRTKICKSYNEKILKIIEQVSAPYLCLSITFLGQCGNYTESVHPSCFPSLFLPLPQPLNTLNYPRLFLNYLTMIYFWIYLRVSY